jgi:hypothetical protein
MTINRKGSLPKITSFSSLLLQVSFALKSSQLQGIPCLAVAYNMVATTLKIDEGTQVQQLKKLTGSIKTRLRFLSEDSQIDFFKSVKGKNVNGKSVMRQFICNPLTEVPQIVLSCIQGTLYLHSFQ